MKKIINSPSNVWEEMLRGMAFTHSDILERLGETGVMYRKYEGQGKVGLVSGGGSGHEPSHAGFVGKGMLSAAVAGEVFTSPTPDQVFEAIKLADKGAGVLLIIKNYTGDVMNFEMAMDMAEAEGIKVDKVIVNDDIAVEDSTYTAGRRGVAGTVLVHKILGAAAEQGMSLEDLKKLGDKVIENTKTVGVAISPATVPAVGKPGFELADDEMEYGIGIHGEPGYRREKIKPSKEIAQELISRLKEECNWKEGDRYGVFVNGMGGTPLMELYIFMNDVQEILSKEGLVFDFKKVASYMTSIEMAGLSLTLIKLEDEKWVEYLKYPVETAAWV